MKLVRAVVALVGTGLLLMTTSSCVSSTPAVSTSPSDAIALLPCLDVIGSPAAPPSDFSIVFDQVALPTGRALQANRSSLSDSAAWLFAKSGLLIRRGTSFDLIVPDEWRGRLTVGWGSPGKRTSHLRVPGCRPTVFPGTTNPIQGSNAWLAYAGGYWVPETACVSVLVKAGQAEQTVRIGVGASCPGQGPPPPPA